MNQFTGLPNQQNYEHMTFDQLEADPVAGPILQKASLEYLRTEDKEVFEREFTGELDMQGYLIQKRDRRAYVKPSQSIGGGKAMSKVVALTMLELRKLKQ